MTKEVFVTIEGLQLGSEEEAVTTTASGTYHLHDGRHYIIYDEKLSEEDAITKNTIKITPNQIDLTKKGTNYSQMIFDINKETQADYQTPYGNLSLEIKTNLIIVSEEEEKLQVQLEYSLAANDSHLSDNRINILIVPKE